MTSAAPRGVPPAPGRRSHDGTSDATGNAAVTGLLYAAAFLLELTMLTVLALSGAAVGDGLVVRAAVGIALPVAAAAVWAVWMAPTSTHRLANPGRLVAQVGLFAVTGLLASAVLAPWVGVAFFVPATLVFGELARREKS
ncbi:YrdB family protein [Rhodococcus triatomae]